jgi:hypothetical protein
MLRVEGARIELLGAAEPARVFGAGPEVALVQVGDPRLAALLDFS